MLIDIWYVLIMLEIKQFPCDVEIWLTNWFKIFNPEVKVH